MGTVRSWIAAILILWIEFGIRFDDRWKVGAAAVAVVAEGSVMVKMGTGVSTQSNCPFTYGLQVGASLYAQAEAPSIFNWAGARYDITGWEKNVIDGGTCPALGSLPTKRSEIRGLPWAEGDNVTSELMEYYSLDKRSEVARSRRLEKRAGVYGPAFRIPVGNFFCPSSETGEGEGTDCSTIQPDWDNDKYLTNNDDYGVVARDLHVQEPYNSSESLEPRAPLEIRGVKDSSLCGIRISSTYPGGGRIPVSHYIAFLSIFTTVLFCSISLPRSFFYRPKD
jgi:chitinase